MNVTTAKVQAYFLYGKKIELKKTISQYSFHNTTSK